MVVEQRAPPHYCGGHAVASYQLSTHVHLTETCCRTDQYLKTSAKTSPAYSIAILLRARPGRLSPAIRGSMRCAFTASRIGCGIGTCVAVSYTHLRAHETDSYLVCRLLL